MEFLKFKQVGVLILIIALLVGCEEEDDRIPIVYDGWGFITQIENDYYITLDGGMYLKVYDLTDPDAIDRIESGDRIYCTFIVKEDSNENPNYYNLIELQMFTIAEYYNSMVEINDENRDEMGDGTATLDTRTSNLSGGYLNLNIQYEKEKGDHVFSLCYDVLNQEEGRPLILELKNNYSEKEDGVITTNKALTFNIINVSDWGGVNEDGSIEFIVRFDNGDFGVKDYVFRDSEE